MTEPDSGTLFPGQPPVRREAEVPEKTVGVSPAMRQYLELKREAADALLFFRMGDFYEMFFEDARKAAAVLDLAITSRQKDRDGVAIPMAGVPHQAAEGYIGRLVRAGFRVAVCEQVEPAGRNRGPVRRRITRVATPSTYLDPSYLEGAEGAYLMAACEHGPAGQRSLGAAWVDLSTGDFSAAEFRGADRVRECAEVMAGFRPREALTPEAAAPLPLFGGGEQGPLVTERPGFWFDLEHARDTLLRHFRTASLEPFGVADFPAATCAAGAAIQYLAETQRTRLTHIVTLRRVSRAGRMVIDPVTQRNLEIFRSLSPAAGEPLPEATLVKTLDRTRTGMGARLLRRRLARPLLDPEAIRSRHRAVAEWGAGKSWAEEAGEALHGCPDLERLGSRAALRIAGPREYLQIAEAVGMAERMHAALEPAGSPVLTDLRSRLPGLAAVRDRIVRTLAEDAPAVVREPGHLIREGVSEELDELRRLRFSSREAIRDLEGRERVRTGIPSLRVRYNQVFGYSIEIGKGYGDRVPGHYVRRQTLVNAERYVTEELKDFEQRLAGAEERIGALEDRLFRELTEEVASASAGILRVAAALAEADVTAGLALTAARRGYVQPEVHDGFEVSVAAGRHPVVEALAADTFVPNDLRLDRESFLMILTGPNMGGKSTFLRQAALHSIMAQAGSFVPADSARLPIVDRVFARVGASDDLARGRSTFLTEMEETAHILHHATRRSLVLLDEVGRGTATYDGLSLAWAIVEHIARRPGLGMKTLFATHYHELTALADAEDGVVNFHVAAREHGEEIVFLRRVAPGGARRSYGIQVARLAGIPDPVVQRAREVLDSLGEGPGEVSGEKEEEGADPPAASGSGGRPQRTGGRRVPGTPAAPLPQPPRADPLRGRLRAVDLDALTPKGALDLLYDLRRQAEAAADS